MSHPHEPWLQEAQAGDMLDAMAVPAWLHRPGCPPRLNPALRRLCGLVQDIEQARDHLGMVAPEDRAVLDQATTDCLTGSGEPPAQSLRLLAGDGGLRPVELTLRRVHWGPAATGRDAVDGVGQRSAAALITCVDHSDFQHVQNMLQAMSGMQRQIVNGAPVASFVVDRNQRISHWNSACERLTGCSADQMIGSTEAWRAFYDGPQPLLAEMILQGIDPAELTARHGDAARPSALVAGAYEKEAFFPHLGSGGLWLDFTAAPLRDGDGQVVGAIITLQDVSQRRRNEDELTRRLEKMVIERSRELQAHARLMDAFIDNAPIGVVYTVNDRVQRSNRRMAEIMGPGPGATAQTAADNNADADADAEPTEQHSAVPFFMSADDARQLNRLAQPLFAAYQPMHHEMWMQHQSGRPLWLQVNAYPVEYSDNATGAWWMIQDRSEVRAAQEALAQRFDELTATNQKLEQAQNQLLQNDKMASIGQLAAGVAHEINNPVGFVSSNLHTLRQYIDQLLKLVDAQALACALPGDAPVQAMLAQVQKSVELDYLKEDLPQLLDESAEGLARVKKIVQDLKDFSRVDQSDWQQADLNAGLDSTLNVVRNEVKYKCEVVKQLGTLPLVLCLAGQLNQVFMNLIVNASHAIAERGTITLSSGTEGGWAWVQVDDTGCGMTEQVRRRMFEPFFTTKDVGKGTGLGLSLSFSIVQRHGGAIQVRSAVGQGSSFRVWVPVGGPPSAGGPDIGQPPRWA